MKRYFIQLAALSLLALSASCKKESYLGGGASGSGVAAVDISIDGLPLSATASRAVVAVQDMTDFTANGFKIAGYYTVGVAGTSEEDLGKSGLFEDNIAIATPNVFNYRGTSITPDENSVIVPPLVDGKYSVQLSRWVLVDRSYLSYFAWASNVAAGVGEGTAQNPISGSTAHASVGAPFIAVTSGTATASLNVDVVGAKLVDQGNTVVRTAIDMNFKHVLSKLKFRVQTRNTVAATLNSAKVQFAEGKVSRSGKFSFDGTDSRLGTWGSYTNSGAATYSFTLGTTLAPGAAAADMAELLIIPQTLEAGAVSVELTYTIANGAGTPSSYTRTVPLDAKQFEPNTSYTYDIMVGESQISINEGRIGSWASTPGTLPNVAGKCDPNVLLLLDAYDAPYITADGTKYWLDRSGWNRHCKIVGSVITYNATEKCYTFNNSGHLDAPAFIKTTSASIESIVRTNGPEADRSQNLFNIVDGSKRVMFTHFPYKGGSGIYFDAGGALAAAGGRDYARVTFNKPVGFLDDYAMYCFSKTITQQEIFRNLAFSFNTLDPAFNYHSNVDLSEASTRQLCREFIGDVKYFKISAVGKAKIDPAEYAELSKRHQIPASEYVNGYVTNGLVLDLQGVQPPKNSLWLDRSGDGANAKLVGGVVYNADNKEYRTGYNGGYLEIMLTEALKKADGFNSHTLELVYEVPKNAYSRHSHFIALGNSDGDGDNRAIFFHAGYGDSWNINYQSPLNSTQRFTHTITIGQSVAEKKSQYIATRWSENGKYRLTVYVNGVIDENPYPSPTVVGTLTRIRIGENPMNISAVRLYNRYLTYEERQQNYAIDKKTYNLQ